MQEVVFGLALLNSQNIDLVNQATQFLKIKLPELVRAYINSGKPNNGILFSNLKLDK